MTSTGQRVSNEPASQDHSWNEVAVTWKVWPTLWRCTGSPRSGTSLCWELSSCAMPPWPLMDEALDETRSFSSFQRSHSGKNQSHVAGLSV
ncbi:hypothetical protein CDEST_09989 [Colletotrichum destructivum]|uniref:Uncharacterized protein n=1 Tax=Colletotrichum destructivum TaxID=34406 RepID=A0AAX4IPQ7_9PEZI|nr:hypothetical protein CDEST_09989 [Colletotrichum destructivum]